MSLCYDFEKWTILTLGLVAISLSVGLLMQYAHGQNDLSSRVDKLIEDTKKAESYKAELINRIQNSTCLQNYLPVLDDNEEANLFPDERIKYDDYLSNKPLNLKH